MDFLKAEIERKKRQVQEKGVMAGPNKKYFKRGDLAEKQREEYIAKHAPNIEELKMRESQTTSAFFLLCVMTWNSLNSIIGF